jgi:hypothetical protein
MRAGIALAVALLACGEEAAPPPGPPGEAGSKDSGCVPGEEPLEDGTCRPAGVRACAEGFESDGRGGCNVVLPGEPCLPGQMAVPGDTRCREVAPCGADPWGDIPVEASTQYVDAAYIGASSGNATEPWTSIAEAIAAAPAGGIVAIAAGDYAEDVMLSGKPVKLWGRCPSMVTVHGSANTYAAVTIENADGAELRGVSVTGLRNGLSITASEALLERVRVHDLMERGVTVRDASVVRVVDSLIESTRQIGTAVYASSITLERCESRDTLASAGINGRGVEIQSGSYGRGSLVVQGSHLHRHGETCILVAGADAIVEASVLRDPLAASALGHALVAQPLEGELPVTRLSSSLVERSVGTGIAVGGGGLTIEDTVVRDTQSPDGVDGGVGVVAHVGELGEAMEATIGWSVVEGSYGAGIGIYSAKGAVDASIVRGTLPGVPIAGAGIVFEPLDSGAASDGSVRWSVIEANQAFGLLVIASNAVIERTAVRRTQPNVAGLFGRGIQVQVAAGTMARGSARIIGSLVEENIEVSVVVDTADIELVDSVVRATLAQSDGRYGDGLAVAGSEGPASAIVTGSTLSDNARAGAAAFGARIELSRSELTCNGIDLTVQSLFGEAELIDQGGNSCGCDAPSPCKAQAAQLEAPAPIGP